jgi:O-antigen/teichoic acid export membrane protein
VILSTAIRTAGLIVALALGYRLKAMAAAAILSLIAGYVFNYRNAREVFPALRFSLSRVRRKMFRRMLGYGIHTCVATIANQLLTMAGPLLVGHFLPTAFVGYFLLPTKLLRYAVDMVCKVGYVTGSNAAEMAAKGERDALYRMGLTSIATATPFSHRWPLLFACTEPSCYECGLIRNSRCEAPASYRPRP